LAPAYGKLDSLLDAKSGNGFDDKLIWLEELLTFPDSCSGGGYIRKPVAGRKAEVPAAG